MWAEAEREKPRQSIEDGRQGTLDYIMLCVTKGFIISIVYHCMYMYYSVCASHEFSLCPGFPVDPFHCSLRMRVLGI